MKINKDNIKGITGTIVFHGLLLAVLLLMALRTPLPLPEEAGVEVNIGNSDEGMGMIQPEQIAAAAQNAAPSASQPSKDDIVTDNNEEAPAIEPVKKLRQSLLKNHNQSPQRNPHPNRTPTRG